MSYPFEPQIHKLELKEFVKHLTYIHHTMNQGVRIKGLE